MVIKATAWQLLPAPLEENFIQHSLGSRQIVHFTQTKFGFSLNYVEGFGVDCFVNKGIFDWINILISSFSKGKLTLAVR